MRGALSFPALFATLFWGLSFVATRVALQAFTPAGLVGARLVLGAALLGALLLLARKSLLPRREDRPRVALLGLILGVHMLLQAEGLRHTTAIHTGWIIGFIPITIALGQRLFLKRPLPPGASLGIALSSAGIALVAWSRPPDFAHARFGDLLQLLGCGTWTAYTLLAARPLERSGSLSVTFLAMATALPATSALALAQGALVEPVSVIARGPWLALVFLGLFCSGLATWLWSLALRTREPARVGAMLYFQPFVTLAGARLLLDEPLTTEALLGGLLVVAGVVRLGRAAVRRNSRPTLAEHGPPSTRQP